MRWICVLPLFVALGCSGGEPSATFQDDGSPDTTLSLSVSTTPAPEVAASVLGGPASSAVDVENDVREQPSFGLKVDFGAGSTTIVIDHPGPGRILVIAQCIEVAAGVQMLDGCDLTEAPRIVADDESTMTVSLAVKAFLAHGSRIETDCRVERCSVAVGDEQFVVLGSEVVDFSGVEARVAPTLTISSLELDSDSNTGSAHVVGAGFAPNSLVNVVQCPRSDRGFGVDAGDCLYSYGASATADADGDLAVSVLAFPLFQRSDGELIDCASFPEKCAFAEPWPDGGARPVFVTFDRSDR